MLNKPYIMDIWRKQKKTLTYSKPNNAKKSYSFGSKETRMTTFIKMETEQIR